MPPETEYAATGAEIVDEAAMTSAPARDVVPIATRPTVASVSPCTDAVATEAPTARAASERPIVVGRTDRVVVAVTEMVPPAAGIAALESTCAFWRASLSSTMIWPASVNAPS